MKALVPDKYDFSTKSHLYEAVWIAASTPMCTDSIVEKIFLHVFPDGLTEDPLYLYETACALSEQTLERDSESRITKSFQDLFRVGNK